MPQVLYCCAAASLETSLLLSLESYVRREGRELQREERAGETEESRREERGEEGWRGMARGKEI